MPTESEETSIQKSEKGENEDSILTNIKLDETENDPNDENQFPIGQKHHQLCKKGMLVDVIGDSRPSGP